MLRRHLDRILSLLIVSIGIGLRVSQDLLKHQTLGREGYLRYENGYFDKYVLHFSHPLAHTFGYAIFFALFFLVYELIAYLIRRLLAALNRDRKPIVDHQSLH